MVKGNEPVIKKRRKTPASQGSSHSTPNSTPQKVENVDIYQNVIAYEEEEALSRDSSHDQALYRKTCNNFCTIMSEISALKLDNSEKAKVEIREKRTQGALMFVLLKKLNRLEKFRTKSSRETLNKVKQQVDNYHLQLQNLLYEILHLKKEVNKCLQFKSKDEEIDLISVEEFYKEAPDSISRPEVTKKDMHQLKLARLEWELQQRKQLSAHCHKLDESKKAAAREIVEQRERLDNLNPQLKNILQVTKPLQDFLGLPIDKIRKQHKAARLLPKPLYVLYVQADSYRQACDPLVSVLVQGDEDAARILAPESQPMADDESDSERENSNSQDNGGSRHRRAASRSDRQEERRKSLLKSHPLSVEVAMKLADGNSIVLNFTYLLNLNIVTVQPRVEPVQPVYGAAAVDLVTPHRILSSLLPGDDGQSSPNAANKYQLRRAGLDSLPSDVGIPYMWAQRLGGIDNIADSTAIGNEALFRKIKKRLDSRLSLCRQIQHLEANLIGVPQSYRSLFPSKLCSNLREFTPLVWEDYSNYPCTQLLVAEKVSEPTDTFFKAVLVRGNAKLTALITLKADYPVASPVFCLLLLWQRELHAGNTNSIRDMERELNVYWKECPQLLSSHLMRLQSCFDIFLEASNVGSNQVEFPRDKVFFRAVRGRDRSVPYKYLQAGGGVFTHR